MCYVSIRRRCGGKDGLQKPGHLRALHGPVEEFCLEEVTTRDRLRDGWFIGSPREDEGHKWEDWKVLKSSKGHMTNQGGWHLAPLVDRAP